VPLGLFASLRGYQPAWLRGDVVAGLTVWPVLVPDACPTVKAAVDALTHDASTLTTETKGDES
jgi:MFS superfamily sulfate permease-like transporter